MPAARQRSRSPFMAWAVMAMIGTCRPVALFPLADGQVVSKPSSSGISMSIKITSNDVAS